MLPGNDILEIRYRSDESVEVRSKGTTSPRTVRRPGRPIGCARRVAGISRCGAEDGKIWKMMGKWWGNGGHPKIIPDDKVFPYFPNLRTGFTIQLPHHGLFGIDLRWWFAYNVSNAKYSSNQPLLQCDSENLNYLICLLVVYSCYHQPPALIFFDRFRIAALATWFWDLEPCSSHIAHHCTTWMLLRHQVHQSDSCDFAACDQDWIKNFATDVFHPEAAKKWCVGRKTDGSRNRCCSGSISPKQCSSWGRTNLRACSSLRYNEDCRHSRITGICHLA